MIKNKSKLFQDTYTFQNEKIPSFSFDEFMTQKDIPKTSSIMLQFIVHFRSFKGMCSQFHNRVGG